MAGIAGATVFLKKNGVTIKSAVTGVDGSYSMIVPAGTGYTLDVQYPPDPGYQQVFDHAVITDSNPANDVESSLPLGGIDVTPGVPVTTTVYSNRTAIVSDQLPVTTNNSVTLNRTEEYDAVLTLPLSVVASFPYTDGNGELASTLKIVSVPSAGVLKYNGVAITANQEISLTGGVLAYAITYESDQNNFAQYNSTAQFAVKTNPSYGYSNTSILTITSTALASTSRVAYGGYTESNIKTRSETPEQAAILPTGSGVYMYKMSEQKVRDAFGQTGTPSMAAIAAYQETICDQGGLWSYFGGVEWYNSGNTMTHRVKPGVDKWSFAGYDADALPPSIVSSTGTDITINEGTTEYMVYASVALGQIDWRMQSTAAYVAMKVENVGEGTTLGVEYSALTAGSPYLTNHHTLQKYIDTSVWGSMSGSFYKTIKLSFYFVDANYNYVADIPTTASAVATTTIQPIEIDFTVSAKAFLRNITLSDAFTAELGGTAEITYDPNGASNAYDLDSYRVNKNYIDQTNQTLNLLWYGIDTDGNKVGDVDTRFGPDLWYWIQLNDGGWVLWGEQVMRGGTAGILDNEVVSDSIAIATWVFGRALTNGDIVDIQIRSSNG